MNSRLLTKAMRLNPKLKVDDFYYSTIIGEKEIKALKVLCGIEMKHGQLFAVVSFKKLKTKD